MQSKLILTEKIAVCSRNLTVEFLLNLNFVFRFQIPAHAFTVIDRNIRSLALAFKAVKVICLYRSVKLPHG